MYNFVFRHDAKMYNFAFRKYVTLIWNFRIIVVWQGKPEFSPISYQKFTPAIAVLQK